MIGRRLGAVALALLMASLATPAAAVIIVYTVTITPLTAVVDHETEFAVTVTNVAGPDDLGCMELFPPATYEVISVSDPVQSDGRDWHATAEGGTIVAWADGGGGRLEVLQWVAFTVTARPKEAGVDSWTHHAHRSQNCDDSEAIGIPVPVTITLPPILPTPTPTPTPRPTAKPTPRPTPRPTPVATPFVAAPTSTPTPLATGQPTPTAAASPTVPPTPAARPDVAPPADGSVDGGGPDGAAVPGGVQVAYADQGGSGGPIGLAGFAAFSGSTVFAVPAAVLGGPGLLILLWVVLQALGTATWIPAVRRLRGRDPDPS